MLKINTVTMEEKIVEILFKTMVVNTEIEQCAKELLNLLDVVKCDNLMCENKAEYFYCNECENYRNDI